MADGITACTRDWPALSDRGVLVCARAGCGVRGTGVLMEGTLLVECTELALGLVPMLDISLVPICSTVTMVDGMVAAGVPEPVATVTLRVMDVSIRVSMSALIIRVFRISVIVLTYSLTAGESLPSLTTRVALSRFVIMVLKSWTGSVMVMYMGDALDTITCTCNEVTRDKRQE